VNEDDVYQSLINKFEKRRGSQILFVDNCQSPSSLAWCQKGFSDKNEFRIVHGKGVVVIHMKV
jgi:hypothetical protein